MSLTGITLGPGISFGSGIAFGAGGVPGGGGTAGIDGAVGYAQIPGPIVPGSQIEDGAGIINGTVGFTIHQGATGVAVSNLTPSNQAFFSGYGTGTKTVLLGAGSTRSSTTVNLVQNSSYLVFYIDQVGATETYNYPFTFI